MHGGGLLVLPWTTLFIIICSYSMGIEASKSYSDGATSRNIDNVYKVYRIVPRDWDDIKLLSKLRKMAEQSDGIDFWLDSHRPDQFADIMVSPMMHRQFTSFLATHSSLNYTITIKDVQRLIYANEFEQKRFKGRKKNFDEDESNTSMTRITHGVLNKRETASRSLIQPPAYERIGVLKGQKYPFGEYANYSTMIRYMRTLEFYYPQIVQSIQIGTTHEGRSIEGVKIGLPGSHKRAIWIDGNIHAREWASGHTALFIINQLVSGYGRTLKMSVFTSNNSGFDDEITHYVNNTDLYIVPCANPDGFEYSRSSLNPFACGSSGFVHCCRGVDLNRNFDFHWGETGSSFNPCSNLYAGRKEFSEPESKSIAAYLRSGELYGRLDGIEIIHFRTMWIHPYSHYYHYYPRDVTQVKDLAILATSRLREIYGTRYKVGTGADLLAPASGGSDDFVKEKLGVKFVYLVELRPQLEMANGFILTPEELLPTAIETFEAIKIVIQGVLRENRLPIKPTLLSSKIDQPANPSAEGLQRWSTSSTNPSTLQHTLSTSPTTTTPILNTNIQPTEPQTTVKFHIETSSLKSSNQIGSFSTNSTLDSTLNRSTTSKTNSPILNVGTGINTTTISISKFPATPTTSSTRFPENMPTEPHASAARKLPLTTITTTPTTTQNSSSAMSALMPNSTFLTTTGSSSTTPQTMTTQTTTKAGNLSLSTLVLSTSTTSPTTSRSTASTSPTTKSVSAAVATPSRTANTPDATNMTTMTTPMSASNVTDMSRMRVQVEGSVEKTTASAITTGPPLSTPISSSMMTITKNNSTADVTVPSTTSPNNNKLYIANATTMMTTTPIAPSANKSSRARVLVEGSVEKSDSSARPKHLDKEILQNHLKRIESLVSLIAGHIGSSAAVEKNGTQNGTATRETNTKIEHAVTGNNSSTTTIHNASIPSWKNETLFATEVAPPSTRMPKLLSAPRFLNSAAFQPKSTSSSFADEIGCSDKRHSCAFWIRATPNICIEKKRFMQINCIQSCNLCNLKT